MDICRRNYSVIELRQIFIFYEYILGTAKDVIQVIMLNTYSIALICKHLKKGIIEYIIQFKYFVNTFTIPFISLTGRQF